jgi:hypothetical protein
VHYCEEPFLRIFLCVSVVNFFFRRVSDPLERAARGAVLTKGARKNNLATTVVAQTLSLQRRDSSRRFERRLQVGRNESRPRRHECLRHVATAGDVKLFLRAPKSQS